MKYTDIEVCEMMEEHRLSKKHTPESSVNELLGKGVGISQLRRCVDIMLNIYGVRK